MTEEEKYKIEMQYNLLSKLEFKLRNSNFEYDLGNLEREECGIYMHELFSTIIDYLSNCEKAISTNFSDNESVEYLRILNKKIEDLGRGDLSSQFETQYKQLHIKKALFNMSNDNGDISILESILDEKIPDVSTITSLKDVDNLFNRYSNKMNSAMTKGNMKQEYLKYFDFVLNNLYSYYYHSLNGNMMIAAPVTDNDLEKAYQDLPEMYYNIDEKNISVSAYLGLYGNENKKKNINTQPKVQQSYYQPPKPTTQVQDKNVRTISPKPTTQVQDKNVRTISPKPATQVKTVQKETPQRQLTPEEQKWQAIKYFLDEDLFELKSEFRHLDNYLSVIKNESERLDYYEKCSNYLKRVMKDEDTQLKNWDNFISFIKKIRGYDKKDKEEQIKFDWAVNYHKNGLIQELQNKMKKAEDKKAEDKFYDGKDFGDFRETYRGETNRRRRV